MRLRGIRDSKRRLESLRRHQERTRPPVDDGRLDPRQHSPAIGPEDTLICSCGGARYSPMAYARHVAGHAMLDSEAGVYVTGRQDPYVLEQERRKRDAVAPSERQHETGERYRDEQGNEWLGVLDAFQRRAWRCVSGARAGAMELDTRLFAVPPDQQPRAVGGLDDSGTIFG